MIASLTGRVMHKRAGSCVLDVNGVGYLLNMTTTSLAALPAEGDSVTVVTRLYVREEELTLFGFENDREKETFEALLTVSGVGPKVALATLSSLSPEELASAVTAGDVATICTVPGIGKKSAQRIVLELADRLGTGVAGAGGRDAQSKAAVAETTDALLGMGFSAAEVAAAIRGHAEGVDAKTLLRYALQRLGGGDR